MEADDQDHHSGPVMGATEESETLPHHVRAGSSDTERPPSAQRPLAGTAQEPEEKPQTQIVNLEDEESGEENDPAVSIEEFDWKDLEQRYHDAIGSCQHDEEALHKEWVELMEVSGSFSCGFLD
jgi:hypothetical protein